MDGGRTRDRTLDLSRVKGGIQAKKANIINILVARRSIVHLYCTLQWKFLKYMKTLIFLCLDRSFPSGGEVQRRLIY